MTEMPQAHELAAEWRAARLLYPLYAALAREFVIDLPPCGDLETGVDAPPQESIEQVNQWYLDMDQRIHVHQLRQFLQTTSLTSEEGLRALLEHHLHKPQRTGSDHDKVDFLLVQFFSHSALSRLEDRDVDMEYVAQVLQPILGRLELTIPSWLEPLEELVQTTNHCRSLNELLSSGVLETGRKLKASENYFQPAAMLAFTRFSFLARRVFFRLMHQDLNTILDGLRELELRGISTLDCRSAQFSADEPIVRLRTICQSWKVMFHAEYSSGQPLRILVDLRKVIDAALARTAGNAATKASASAVPRAQAAAARTNSGTTSSEVSEFEVSSGSPEWDQDAAAHQAGPKDEGAA
jgi:hypothetical protein